MPEKHDDYEPIIATRRSREPQREDTPPVWRLVLAIGGCLVVAGLLVWWWTSGSTSDSVPSTAVQQESAPPDEELPEITVEQAPTPPARDLDANADIAQAPEAPTSDDEPEPIAEEAPTAMPEVVPEPVSSDEPQEPVPPAAVSVRIISPDPQVRVELHGPLGASPPLTGRAGEVIDVPPGTYRVVASGTELETFEHEVTFDGERALEYVVELCGERKYQRESFAGRVIEERACASTTQCQSMFMVLSEEADRLVKDRDFKAQECAKWRPDAAPDGRWTLNTQCGGATAATTCRIEIAEGTCTFAEPRRSVRGTACPRAELR